MEQSGPHRTAVLLPRRERYAEIGAGAVATVVDGLACFSAERSSLRVLGTPVNRPLTGASFTPVALAPFWCGGKTRRYLTGAARLLKGGADVVEIHNRPKYAAFLYRALPPTALVLYLHNDPRTMEGSKTPSERRKLMSCVRAVICVSEFIRDCFLEGLDDMANKVFIVHNAVDTETLTPLPGAAKRKEIIFIGRTILDKGPHLLVAAAERLLPRYPDWKVVLVGGRYFGEGKAEPYEEALFRRVTALGGQGEVTGYIPRLQAIKRLQCAAIAVLPSLWDEPIQLAAMEAAACGCAVITTRRGGIPEGIGEAALYLPEETAEAVECLLRDLMDHPESLKAWQQKARTHVAEQGGLRESARRLDALRLHLAGNEALDGQRD